MTNSPYICYDDASKKPWISAEVFPEAVFSAAGLNGPTNRCGARRMMMGDNNATGSPSVISKD